MIKLSANPSQVISKNLSRSPQCLPEDSRGAGGDVAQNLWRHHALHFDFPDLFAPHDGHFDALASSEVKGDPWNFIGVDDGMPCEGKDHIPRQESGGFGGTSLLHGGDAGTGIARWHSSFLNNSSDPARIQPSVTKEIMMKFLDRGGGNDSATAKLGVSGNDHSQKLSGEIEHRGSSFSGGKGNARDEVWYAEIMLPDMGFDSSDHSEHGVCLSITRKSNRHHGSLRGCVGESVWIEEQGGISGSVCRLSFQEGDATSGVNGHDCCRMLTSILKDRDAIHITDDFPQGAERSVGVDVEAGAIDFSMAIGAADSYDGA